MGLVYLVMILYYIIIRSPGTYIWGSDLNLQTLPNQICIYV